MNNFKLTTPVVFIIFNRPDTAIQVFERIREAKPSKLLVIADGPRKDKLGEAEKCEKCRDIINRVDWECEVLTNYSDVNLGCKVRVSSGLDWVFENVEEAIILEDDCLPHISFFRFCQELLERYRDDTRIAKIGGFNKQDGWKKNEDSYYFSRFSGIWGWATWRRVWKNYDVAMRLWPKVCDEKWLEGIFKKRELKYYQNIFQAVYDDNIDTWDYQFFFMRIIQNSVGIAPNVNLVSNIGFGEEATHTKDKNNPEANTKVSGIEFPLKHPDFLMINEKADAYVIKKFLRGTSLKERILNKILRSLKLK